MAWFDVRDGNPLKRMLGAGETAVGTFIRIPALEVAEICAHGGCDFVVIDAEHTPVGWERLAAMIVAAESAGTTPILRVSNASRDLISRGLDAGAHGIMVPQIESADVAAAAVAATRYGPGGTRGTAGSRRAAYGMAMPYAEFVPAANEAMLVVLQIESGTGVDAVDEIASVAGIDCLFIGLTDLSVNLGYPGDYEHPVVQEQVERVFAAANSRGIPVGVPATGAAMAQRYAAMGARFLAGGDMGLFARAVTDFVREVGPSNE